MTLSISTPFSFYLKDDMDLNESITSVMSFFHDIQV